MATSSESGGHEIIIPVQLNATEESRATTSTGMHEEQGQDSRQKFDEEIRRMEAEMERVKRGESLNSPDGSNVNVTTVENSDGAPGSHKRHETRTTKMHSYHKTTKTETQTKKVEGSNSSFPVDVTSTTSTMPRSSTPIRDPSPGGGQVYRTTVTPGTTITIKASSHDSTPIKKVVIVNESTGQQREIDLSDQRGLTPESAYDVKYQAPPPEFRTSTPIVTGPSTSFSGGPTTDGIKKDGEDEILREERRKTTSYSSTSTTSSTNKQNVSGDVNVPFSKMGFDEDLETQKNSSPNISSAQPGRSSDRGFDWDSWATKQQQDFRVVETDALTGEKRLKLKYELSPREYDAGDINIKVTKDNKILIKAEHKETTGGKSLWRECSKEYLLPKGVNLEGISSGYNPDTGVLSISVPLPKNI